MGILPGNFVFSSPPQDPTILDLDLLLVPGGKATSPLYFVVLFGSLSWQIQAHDLIGGHYHAILGAKNYQNSDFFMW